MFIMLCSIFHQLLCYYNTYEYSEQIPIGSYSNNHKAGTPREKGQRLRTHWSPSFDRYI